MRNTIKKHKDFLFADMAPTVKSDLFIAKARPAMIAGGGRYGLIVTKKTFKLAVRRNRAKRLLRVWIRDNDHLMRPDLDYVFIARYKILDAGLPVGAAAVATALSKLNAISKP